MKGSVIAAVVFTGVFLAIIVTGGILMGVAAPRELSTPMFLAGAVLVGSGGIGVIIVCIVALIATACCNVCDLCYHYAR